MAVLQIELDRKRFENYPEVGLMGYGAERVISDLLGRALRDTVTNGGTFVVVVSDQTITAVQHEDVTPLESGDA